MSSKCNACQQLHSLPCSAKVIAVLVIRAESDLYISKKKQSLTSLFFLPIFLCLYYYYCHSLLMHSRAFVGFFFFLSVLFGTEYKKRKRKNAIVRCGTYPLYSHNALTEELRGDGRFSELCSFCCWRRSTQFRLHAASSAACHVLRVATQQPAHGALILWRQCCHCPFDHVVVAIIGLARNTRRVRCSWCFFNTTDRQHHTGLEQGDIIPNPLPEGAIASQNAGAPVPAQHLHHV